MPRAYSQLLLPRFGRPLLYSKASKQDLCTLNFYGYCEEFTAKYTFASLELSVVLARITYHIFTFEDYFS
jgi:hypothetical protein